MQKASTNYGQLEEVYQILYSEYIKNNGLDLYLGEINYQQVFKVVWDKTEFKRSDNKEFLLFVKNPNFGIEDKFFMNRVALLLFKKLGNSVTFDEFYKHCKILQNGLFEQKLILLMDLLDEDDNKIIKRQEISKLFTTSFMQDSLGQYRIDDMVSCIFALGKSINVVRFEQDNSNSMI